MTGAAQVTRLIDALADAGVPVSAPADLGDLRELEREIGPLRLPGTLRDLWERIDAATFRMNAWPRLQTPAFALFSWRLSRDNGTFPPGLLPFCYDSHNHLLVELDHEGFAGGTVFEASFDDRDARVRCAHIEDWVDVLVAVLAEGAFDRQEVADGRVWLDADQDRYEALMAESLSARGAHPVYGNSLEVSLDPERWPSRWYEAAEPVRRLREPRGPTTTIASLLSEARSADARGTVAGASFKTIVGRGNGPWRLLLTDRTGVIDVACPPEIPGYHALNTNFLEMDLRVPKLRGPKPAVDWRAQAAEYSEEPHAEPRLHQLIQAAEPQAIAEAVRTLPPGPPPAS